MKRKFALNLILALLLISSILMGSVVTIAAKVDTAIVDRFEGKYAVLEYPDLKFVDCKRTLLPKDVREGDVIVKKNDKWSVDKEKTKERKNSINKKYKKLFS